MAGLRLALVTDIHHGSNYGTKLGASALSLIERFREWCATESPDGVVEMGDRINNVSAELDARHTAEIGAAFARFASPVTHLIGNHDCHALTVAEAEQALGSPLRSQSRDQGGFHLVFWNANVEKGPERMYQIAPADLEWLACDLAATGLPTVVFSHIPLDSGSMAGNLYFEQNPTGRGGYANAAAAREVIESRGHVVLCIAGHTHWNAFAQIDGIPYLTVPSLTEGFMSWPAPACAWAECTLGSDIHVRIHGEAPLEYRLPMRRRGAHWVSHDKPYAPKPPARVVPKGRFG